MAALTVIKCRWLKETEGSGNETKAVLVGKCTQRSPFDMLWTDKQRISGGLPGQDKELHDRCSNITAIMLFLQSYVRVASEMSALKSLHSWFLCNHSTSLNYAIPQYEADWWRFSAVLFTRGMEVDRKLQYCKRSWIQGTRMLWDRNLPVQTSFENF